jgi:hypothetical protein
MFESHKRIVCFADANEFVQLHLNRGRVTVLRILDQEHHQKRHDGRSGVDNKLPCVRETEERTGYCPDHHGPESKGEDPGSTHLAGADLRDFGEQSDGDLRRLGGTDARGRSGEPFFLSKVLGMGHYGS